MIGYNRFFVNPGCQRPHPSGAWMGHPRGFRPGHPPAFVLIEGQPVRTRLEEMRRLGPLRERSGVCVRQNLIRIAYGLLRAAPVEFPSPKLRTSLNTL
jgi:hypothetical protein